jgi:hypothetical protein
MENQQIQQSESPCHTQVAKQADKSTRHPLEYAMVSWFLDSRHNVSRFAINDPDFEAIQDFRDFTGKPPWQWSEIDFDSWCHLERFQKLKPRKRMIYQGVILSYLRYLETDLFLRGLGERRHWARFR